MPRLLREYQTHIFLVLEVHVRLFEMVVASLYMRAIVAYLLSETLQARALRDGLILAGQIGCNRIEVNSDCMDFVQVMKRRGNSLRSATTIYECTMLCHNFTKLVF
jgi:hypothetical protein